MVNITTFIYNNRKIILVGVNHIKNDLDYDTMRTLVDLTRDYHFFQSQLNNREEGK